MDYSYSYNAGGGAAAAFLIVMWIVMLAFAVLAIIGLWKTLNKAGLPGWAAIIPFYNEYNVVKLSNRPVYFFWIMLGCSLLAWIPFIGWLLIIGIFVLWIFMALDIAAKPEEQEHDRREEDEQDRKPRALAEVCGDVQRYEDPQHEDGDHEKPPDERDPCQQAAAEHDPEEVHRPVRQLHDVVFVVERDDGGPSRQSGLGQGPPQADDNQDCQGDHHDPHDDEEGSGRASPHIVVVAHMRLLLLCAQMGRSRESSAPRMHILPAERCEHASAARREGRAEGPGGRLCRPPGPVPDQTVRAWSAQMRTGLYSEVPKARTRYMIHGNSQSRTPNPEPWPKFLAMSRATMRRMTMLTKGMK